MPRMSDEGYRDFLMAGTRTGKLATARKDGRPHVTPIWFVMDRDDILFMTGRDAVKGHAIRHDGRVALCVDDENPPYAFALIEGPTSISEDPDEMLRWSTRIGEEQAEQFGKRNAVPGELLVRLAPTKIVSDDMLGG